MSGIATITVTPSAAAEAYSRTERGGPPGAPATDTNQPDFGATLQRALSGAVTTAQDAEAKAAQAIDGGGSLTDVVTAISRAELTLQTATAIRDRVVQAYQDIMRMPI